MLRVLYQPMEDEMAALKSLSFVELPKVETNPTMIRRKEVIARLELQKNLALDPKFVRTIKTKDGEKQQKVRPSWVENPDGTCYFVLRVGFQPVEFAKGCTAIRVKSRDELPEVIDTLSAAVAAGELDDKIMPAKKAGSSSKRKSAA
jgi:hypothetical protein